MEQKDITQALILAKRIGNLINDVMDLSKQIAEALDRNDQVSVQMLAGMRVEPVNNLKKADESLRSYISEMTIPEDRERLRGLLNGDISPREDEELLAKQARSNSAQLAKLIAIDKVINTKITREKSIYAEK